MVDFDSEPKSCTDNYLFDEQFSLNYSNDELNAIFKFVILEWFQNLK